MIIVIKMQKKSAILISPIVETRKGALIHVDLVHPSPTATCRTLISEHGAEEVNSGLAVDAILKDWNEVIKDIIVRTRHIMRQHRTIFNFHELMADVIKAIFAMKILEARVQILKIISDGML